jgi:hypothetical protein
MHITRSYIIASDLYVLLELSRPDDQSKIMRSLGNSILSLLVGRKDKRRVYGGDKGNITNHLASPFLAELCKISRSG